MKSQFMHLGEVKAFHYLRLKQIHKMLLFLNYSIENFKRPQAEVDALLSLATEKFQRLIDEKDKLAENGVRVNVLGNLTLLPQKLQELVHEAMKITRSNTR